MTGLYYEELEVGTHLEHAIRRTVTETDNVLFSALTMNPQPLHLDEEFSKGTFYGRRLVNSVFTLGLVTGISVTETTMGTTLGNLGFSAIAFPHPVFHGDTIHSATEVLEKRVSKSRPDAGLVTFIHRGFNQRDQLVCECTRTALVMRRSS